MGTLSRSLKNNDASGPWRRLSVPGRLTEWELMLASLELTENEARSLLGIGGAKACTLRLWIEQNYRVRYIPTQFLTRRQMRRFRWD
jgi:hypothetical protein